MDVTAVRKAIATQISAVIPAPLTATWYVPTAATEPQVWVKPGDIEYDKTMRNGVTRLGSGMDTLMFDVVLIVSKADDQAAQLNLDQYLHSTGALSIKAAIEAGRAQYGGTAYSGVFDDCWVSSVSSYQYYSLGAETYLGATFKLMVIGRGDL